MFPPEARHAAGLCPGESVVLAVPTWARVFPGTLRQVRAARHFVAGLLDGSPFRDDAVIIVSELATNATLHSRSGNPGGLVTVQVTRWRLGVRIAVTDQGSGKRPVVGDSGPGREPAESGHGLYLVGSLAARLDWHDDVSGRTIHAILGSPPPDPRYQQLGSPPGEPARLPQPV
jgi:anti-sigma regulatory factor (Ser/Thr protein kinase)